LAAYFVGIYEHYFTPKFSDLTSKLINNYLLFADVFHFLIKIHIIFTILFIRSDQMKSPVFLKIWCWPKGHICHITDLIRNINETIFNTQITSSNNNIYKTKQTVHRTNFKQKLCEIKLSAEIKHYTINQHINELFLIKIQTNI